MKGEDFYVEAAADIDVTSIGLTMDEGFIYSRALGQRQTVTELCSVSHFSSEKTRTIVTSLVKKGALTLGGAGRTTSGAIEGDYDDVTFSPASLAEEADLTLDQKKRILFVESKLDDWNHYALLGLKRSAKGADIKKGYFRASKEFHPDSFFRREIGSFRGRVDVIFRKMKAAYDTLNNDEAREAYDGTLSAADFTPAERRELEELVEVAAEKTKAEKVETDRDERLAQRLKSKRLKRNPMIERIKRGREFLEMAESSLNEKKFDDASRHARMAENYTKGDANLSQRTHEIIQQCDRGKAKNLARRGEAFAATRPEAETERAAAELVRLAHGDAEFLSVAAKMYSIMGSMQKAMKTAQMATSNDSSSEVAWETLLYIAEKNSSWHAAVRAAEALLELSPKDSSVKDRLKKAKRELKFT